MKLSSQVFAVAVVAVAALVVLATALAATLTRKGAGRAALVAGLLPLALLPPVLALALAGFQTSALFSGMATNTTVSGQEIVRACRDQWLVPRVGFGLTALIAAAGLLGGLLRFGAADRAARDLSLRRAAVLCLLPLLGLLTAGLLIRELRLGLGIIQAVMVDTQGDPARAAAAREYLGSAGLGQAGSAGIAAITERLALSLQVAMAGGATAAVVLLGLALTGLILGWRVRTGAPFAAVSSLLWLVLLLASGLLALGFGAPPVF